MKFLSLASCVALLPALARAGLEDAKHSTVLSASNFEQVISGQEVGTLVAFFAPWCGHCKNLEPVWTKIAKAFQGDDRCKVAHLDADQATAKPLASKFGVSGFPTIKFIPNPANGGGEQSIETYQGARSEEAFLKFLNEKCGTDYLPGGLLSASAGRIPSLDTLASLYLSPTATRPDLLASASALAASITGPTSELAAYYIKVMSKWVGETAPEAEAWIEKEKVRLGKLASRKGAIAGKKLDELKMKQNILAAFKYVEKKAAEVVDKVEDVAEDVVNRVREEL